MTELELMELSQPLADIYMAMEEDLMVEIARRIAVSGEVIPTSEWRLKKLAEAGALNKKTIEIIAKYTGLQAETLTETIEAAAYGAIKDLEPAFQKVAEQGIISSAAVPASETTKRVVKNFRSQAASDLNLVNTVMQYKSREAYKALVNKTYKTVQAVENAKNRQELLNVLGKHTLSVVTGGESRQAAVRKCIEEFSEKGIPAFVDKAGREWSPEAYINMDIKTTVSNTARTAQEARFDEYGIDLIQVSSHNGARPKCAKDQGKLYSRSNKSGTAYDGDGNPIEFFPFSQTSFGKPDGLFGINCHHKEYAFISGVNFQRYFPYDEEENAAQYKKIQNQRRLERRVRETKRNIAMLKEVGDTEGVKLAKKTLAQRNKAYNDYCAENNLKPHSDRLAVVNAKAVKNAVKDIDNGVGSGIINIKEEEHNYHYLSKEEFDKMGVSQITLQERQQAYRHQVIDNNGNYIQEGGYIRTSNSFSINKTLRTGDLSLLSDDDKITISTLEKIMDNNLSKIDILVDRYTDPNYIRQNFGIELKRFNTQSTNLCMQEILNNHINDIIEEKGFTSASWNPDENVFKDSRPVQLVISIPKGVPMYVTDNKDESEIILKRGTKFKITNCDTTKNDDDDDLLRVFLEVIKE